METSNKPTREEREIFAGYGRKYSRGNSGPRLIDIASASERGKASVMAVLYAFTRAGSSERRNSVRAMVRP